MSTINENVRAVDRTRFEREAAGEIAEAKRLVVKAGKLALLAGADPDLLGRLAALTIDLDCCRGILDPEWATEGRALERTSPRYLDPRITCPRCGERDHIGDCAPMAIARTLRSPLTAERPLPAVSDAAEAQAAHDEGVASVAQESETDALLDWGADVGRQRGARRARAASFDASGEHQEDGVQSANPDFPD